MKSILNLWEDFLLIFPSRAKVSTLAARIAFLEKENGELQSKKLQIEAEKDSLQRGWLPGHFYSPYPDLAEIQANEDKIYGYKPKNLPGICLNEAKQISLFLELVRFYAEQPFSAHKRNDCRYYFENPNFRYGEGIIFYSLIRHLQPQKIIEVGSGYSSSLILDTNELFFDNSIYCTFIEPYPELLDELLRSDDYRHVERIEQKVQDVDPNKFMELEANDILFIDSSHVSKIASDVNHLFFEILPILNSGVFIHIHDIGYPFEYPKEWVYQGRAWNEAYILRSFLQYNHKFEIRFFNAYLAHFQRTLIEKHMPLFVHNPGSSLWLQKF